MPPQLLLFTLTLAADPATTGPVDKSKLDEALQLPQLTLQVNFSPGLEAGIRPKKDKLAGTEDEITALRRAMKGDASDAERYLRLTRLCSDSDKGREAKEAAGKAAELFRRQLQDHRGDGRLLVALGESLNLQGEPRQAEKVLREAVRVAPGNWVGWSALADSLQSQVTDEFFGEVPNNASLSGMARLIAQRKPSPETIARAKQRLDEASSIRDRAVTAAPDEPGPYAQRAASVFVDKLTRRVLRAFEWESHVGLTLEDYFRDVCTEKTIADLWRASELDPQDVQVTVAAMWFELMAVGLRSQGPDSEKIPPLKRMSPEGRKAVQRGLARLERLAAGKDPKAAAEASECLGVLRLATGGTENLGSVCETLRRAVTLDPSRELAWDLLVGMLATDGKIKEYVSISDKRVRNRDTARNRFLLAKALETAGDTDKADEQVRAALERDPAYFPARLAGVIILLKKGGGKELAEAKQCLSQLARELDGPAEELRWANFTATQAAYYALAGKKAEARRRAEEVLERDPKDPRAKAVLAALGK